MTADTTVVKCGGGSGIDLAAVCADVAAMARGGRRVVLVHGGAVEVDRLADRLGVPQRRLTTPGGSSSRYTDPATLEVLLLALAGKVKPALLAELARQGARAVGLTGIDGGLLAARRLGAHRAVVGGRRVVVHDDHSGRISRVDPAVLTLLLDGGVIPVVSPPALGEDGGAVNVDADRAAAAIAGTLRADRLILLTAAPGVLRVPDDETSVLTEYRLPPDGPVGDVAVGGMTVKLLAARDALLAGVRSVVVADGRRPRPVIETLAGAGTGIRLTGRGPRSDGSDQLPRAARTGAPHTPNGSGDG